MRVLMTGGGTGGHVNPALAIANTIKQNDSTAEIAYVGTKHGIESKLVPAAGYPLYFVEIRGIRRSLSQRHYTTKQPYPQYPTEYFYINLIYAFRLWLLTLPYQRSKI